MSAANSSGALLLLGLILGINAFFAASEVALLSVRQSRLHQLAQQGVSAASAALSLLAQRERLLSAVQVGVTLASLGLGWAGEDLLFRLLEQFFRPLVLEKHHALLSAVSFGIAFLVITFFHVVIGEVVPKNLGVEKAERLALITAPAMLVFCRISAPFVAVVERASTGLSRALGVQGQTHGGGHSAEELRLIVESSRGSGHLEPVEERIIQRVLDFDELAVREVMVPRARIVGVPVDAPLDRVLSLMTEYRHSRLPVWGDSPDTIEGILHYKDLLPYWFEQRAAQRGKKPVSAFRVHKVMREATVVPETKPASEMLEEFRSGGSHLALVVDEFGTITGMITLKDVLEALVGSIGDEHRRPAPAQTAAGTRVLDLDGAAKLRDLEEELGIELHVPEEISVETLAGFLLLHFQRIPKEGEGFGYEGRSYTVTQMEGNRIVKVRMEAAITESSNATPA